VDFPPLLCASTLPLSPRVVQLLLGVSIFESRSIDHALLIHTTTMSSASTTPKKPVCIIAIGMAGSGKSTFVQRLNAHLHSQPTPAPPYVLNLDPAVTNLPFEANIDIRDTVEYHEVMKQCAVAFLHPTTLP
jgi:adenylylsulfate kinase-like enzyme